MELEEARILALMATGKPIRAHMAALDETAGDRLVDVFVERYREVRQGAARPFPGVTRLLRRLRARGMPIAVVTSKLREDAVAELASTGLDRLVDTVIAFEDTDEHKPDAAPHLAALRRLGARGGVGVGDLPTDIQSAQAAGLRTLGVAWGYSSANVLLAAGADRVCKTAAELADALDEPPRA